MVRDERDDASSAYKSGSGGRWFKSRLPDQHFSRGAASAARSNEMNGLDRETTSLGDLRAASRDVRPLMTSMSTEESTEKGNYHESIID